MEQEFDTKRGITSVDIQKYEERQREEYSKDKLTKQIRITSGGNFEDFDDIKSAIKYLLKKVIKFNYASINVICPELFLKKEDLIKENGNG